MKKFIFISLLIGLLFAQSIDAEKSFVKFTVRNMVIRDVVGTITGMQGTVIFNIEEPDSSKFDVTVDLNTINTENSKRDKHLLNEDFFESSKWPTIQFKSKKVNKHGELYGVLGDLTIKNITKEIFVPFSFQNNNDSMVFRGGEVINRYDYNVGNDYDTFKIGNEIKVEVVCILNKNE